VNQGNLPQALAHYDRAIELAPDYVEAHANRAFALLASGDFERGWVEHEWRWRSKGIAPRAFPQPAWDGTPQAGPELALLSCRLSEADVRWRLAALWAYLEEGKAQKVHEGYLTSRRSPWYAQEDRPAAPFLCTYMGRPANGGKPFGFLWNRSAATPKCVPAPLPPGRAARGARG